MINNRVEMKIIIIIFASPKIFFKFPYSRAHIVQARLASILLRLLFLNSVISIINPNELLFRKKKNKRKKIYLTLHKWILILTMKRAKQNRLGWKLKESNGSQLILAVDTGTIKIPRESSGDHSRSCLFPITPHALFLWELSLGPWVLWKAQI